MHRFVTRLTSIIVTGFLIIACEGDVGASNPKDQRISITLVHPKTPADSIDLLVPVAFLGPAEFPTSKEDRQGGKHKKVLIEFYYPSMTPLVNAPSTENEIAMYAAVYAAPRGVIRSYADLQLSLQETAYGRSDDNVCDLEEYKSKRMVIGHPHIHASTLYYHRSASDVAQDVFVHCREIVMYGHPKCRTHFETEAGLEVILNLVPRDQVCQWRKIVAQVGEFVDGFVVGE